MVEPERPRIARTSSKIKSDAIHGFEHSAIGPACRPDLKPGGTPGQNAVMWVRRDRVDEDGTPDHRPSRRGPNESRDCGAASDEAEDRRMEPHEDLPQAERPLANGARGHVRQDTKILVDASRVPKVWEKRFAHTCHAGGRGFRVPSLPSTKSVQFARFPRRSLCLLASKRRDGNVFGNAGLVGVRFTDKHGAGDDNLLAARDHDPRQ